MKLYNTATRSVEEITVSDNKLSVYSCGPTVYDYPHAGNWFTFLRYDTLVRCLQAQNIDVNWVMNITDVGHLVSDADEGEDKLEKGARRESKTAWDVATFYGDYFADGLKRLNSTTPSVLPKATDHIPEQIDLIKQLESKGHTYVIDDGVYFDTSTFSDYASFAKLDLEDLKAGARVELNPQKRNASDFAVWKFSPAGGQRDMEWESPWGLGFPGWHIECSAMAMKYLGQTIDIHAGGIDHIPVHHTNEIAQSEAASGVKFARYWLHANHISVNGEKISKSLGNGITLEAIESKGYSLRAFRLNVLESHYRTQSKFSWEGLEAAQNRLKSFDALAVLQWQATQSSDSTAEAELIAYLNNDVKSQIMDSIENDLNTPEVLSTISELIAKFDKGLPEPVLGHLRTTLNLLDNVLGLDLAARPDITTAQKSLLSERQTARENRDWKRADQIRDQLLAEGISINDIDTGQLWYRS